MTWVYRAGGDRCKHPQTKKQNEATAAVYPFHMSFGLAAQGQGEDHQLWKNPEAQPSWG